MANEIKLYSSKVKRSPKSIPNNIETYNVSLASNRDLYQTNSFESAEKELWNVIENWVKSENNKRDIRALNDLLLVTNEKLSGYIIKELISQENNFKIASFINLVRYYPILIKYISKDNYNVSILDEIIRLRIFRKNVNLILHFRSDFLIDFYSYDNDVDKDEKLVYTMKGTFSSSSKIRKSYKIERLLSLFDRCDDEMSKLNYYSLLRTVNVYDNE